jgi:hypothetical protein
MRKISIFCRPSGNFCRVFSALLNVWLTTAPSNMALGQTIIDPGVPTSAIPPVIPTDRDPALLRKRDRERRQMEEVQSEKDSHAKIVEQRSQEKARAEAQIPRQLYGFAEVSLLQPKAIVSAGRSKYVSDLTSHFSAYVRTFWNQGADSIQPWAGIRIAPFGGYGTQGRLTARFAHTWMGPCLGVGKIYPANDPQSDNPSRYGILWSGGVAGVYREVADDESSPPLPKDFSPTPWSFDPPGAWSELRVMRVTMGAVGVGGLVGVQTGSGKIFLYAGATVSGFY